MTLAWDRQDLYAYPPFGLIQQVLLKVQQEPLCRLLLLAPWQPRAPWFPLLLQLTVDIPIILPFSRTLLRQPHTGQEFKGQNPKLLAWTLANRTLLPDPVKNWKFALEHHSVPLLEPCINQNGMFSAGGPGPQGFQLALPL